MAVRRFYLFSGEAVLSLGSIPTGEWDFDYTASTISFTATGTISDSASGFGAGSGAESFKVGDFIEVSGSASNDGYYQIASHAAGTLVVTPTNVVTEAAGASVTISVVQRYQDLAGDLDTEFDWRTLHLAQTGSVVNAFLYNHIGPSPGTRANPTPAIDYYYSPVLSYAANATTNPYEVTGYLPSWYSGPELSFLAKAHGDPFANPNTSTAGGTEDVTVTLKYGEAANCAGMAGPSWFLGRVAAVTNPSGNTLEITLTESHGKTLGSKFQVFMGGFKSPAPGFGSVPDPQLLGRFTATADSSDNTKFQVTLAGAYTGSAGTLPGGMVVAPRYKPTSITNPSGNTLRVVFDAAHGLPNPITAEQTKILIGGVTGSVTNVNRLYNHLVDDLTYVNATTVDVDFGAAVNLTGIDLTDAYVETETCLHPGVKDEPWSLYQRVQDAVQRCVTGFSSAFPSDTIECAGAMFDFGALDTAGYSASLDSAYVALSVNAAELYAEAIDAMRAIVAAEMTEAQSADEIPAAVLDFTEFEPITGDVLTGNYTWGGRGVQNSAATRYQVKRGVSLTTNCALVETADLSRAISNNVNAGGITPIGMIKLGERLYDTVERLRGVANVDYGNAIPIYIYTGQSQAVGTTPAYTVVTEDDPDFDGSWYNAAGTTVVRQRQQFIWNALTKEFQEYAPQINANTYDALVASRHPAVVNTSFNVLPLLIQGTVGPEASLSNELRDNHTEGVYVLKLAVGNASLATPNPTLAGAASWAPDANDLYAALLREFDAVREWCEQQGLIPDVRGFLFDQGEADAVAGQTSNYSSELTAFIAQVRADFATSTSSRAALPFVIGRLQTHDRYQGNVTAATEIQAAQDAVAAADAQVGIANMQGLPIREDNIHRTWRASVEAGYRLADAFLATSLGTDGPDIGAGSFQNPRLSSSSESSESAGSGPSEFATT